MTPEQHDSKTEGRPKMWKGRNVRAFAKAILHGDDEHKAWLLEAAENFIAGKPLPAPRGKGTQSPSEPGRGDDLARQEHMAELEREINTLRSNLVECADTRSAQQFNAAQEKRIAVAEAELSRLRNEGGLDHPDSIIHELGGLPASPSDLPAREAIEQARSENEKADVLKEIYKWTGSAWLSGGDDKHDYRSELYRFLCGLIGWFLPDDAAALQPLSQGNGEAVGWRTDEAPVGVPVEIRMPVSYGWWKATAKRHHYPDEEETRFPNEFWEILHYNGEALLKVFYGSSKLEWRDPAAPPSQPEGVMGNWKISEEAQRQLEEIDRATVRPGDPRMNTVVGGSQPEGVREALDTSPGPWAVYVEKIGSVDDAKRELAQLVDGTPDFQHELYMLVDANGLCPAVTGCGKCSKANAEFIARAYNERNATPSPGLVEAAEWQNKAIIALEAIAKLQGPAIELGPAIASGFFEALTLSAKPTANAADREGDRNA